MSESTTEEPQTADLEVIVPDEGRITVNGMDCKVRRLKTREFLALTNVMVRGLGPSLSTITVDLTDQDAVARDMSALMLLAVPNAVEEFTLFLRFVVEPVDDSNRAKVGQYLADNPDVEVLLDVFEHIATQEKDDLITLVGKAQAMWKRVAQVYQPQT